MLKKWFIILFTLLFALQTTAAVMDEYQPHDSNENPSAFDHGHDSIIKHKTTKQFVSEQSSIFQINNTQSDKTQSDDIQTDSHHCCHCHANSQIFASIVTHLVFNNNTNALFEYHFIYPSVALSPKLRPPIV